MSKHGKNELGRSESVSALKIFIHQFKNIIVLILCAASLTAFSIGDIMEGVAVLALVIVNALFGFFTEYKAEKSLEELREMITLEAKVIRSGEVKEIEAEQVVPGDIMVMEEGDRVSADGRLISAEKLDLNESILTGESETISKEADFSTDKEISLAARKNMVYMGTTITRGQGVALVTGTGADTEMGQIGSLLGETESEETPLERRLDKLGKSLVNVTLVITAIVTIIGILVGEPIKEMLKTGIALAIASVPEGLPIVATITLAIGMKKMARNNALVRRLPAVETLGSTTVICTDKTGTLTENQMTLKEIYLADDTIKVSGTGYKPEGEFSTEEGDLNPDDNSSLSIFLQAGILCSNAVIRQDEENSLWEVVGDPTEGALVAAARKAGYRRDMMEEDGFEPQARIPFSSDRKYMAVSYKTPDGDDRLYIKGAPSVILRMCNNEYRDSGLEELTEERVDQLEKRNKEMAGEGLRVLALACHQGQHADSEDDIKGILDSGITFLGFAGIIDPPRQDAKDAIQEAHSAGIETRMITGDQKDTALSIAEKVSIEKRDGGAITGQKIEEMSVEELSESIDDYSVFTRVSPENKLEIVEALKKKDEVTAMTGDGVNDAPALKKADIGIAMGQRGTSVARSASEMVLLDDSFDTIVKAIKQGRVIFDNIHKFIYYLFSSNLSKIIYIFLAVLLQIPIPLLALQILWLNLMIDVFPALSLGWEVPEPQVMDRPPRNPKKEILTNRFKKKLLLHSIIIALGPLLTYIFVLNQGYSVQLSRTVSFTVLAFTKLFHVFNARRKEGTGFDKTIFKNIYLWAVGLGIVFQLLAVYNPFLQMILSTTGIPLEIWPPISLGFILPIIVIQFLNTRSS